MVLTQRLGVLDRVPAPNSCYLAAFSLGLLISVSSISLQACFQTPFLRHTTWTVPLTASLLAFTELHWPRVHHWNFLLPFTPFLKMSHLEIKWNCSAVFLRIIFFFLKTFFGTSCSLTPTTHIPPPDWASGYPCPLSRPHSPKYWQANLPHPFCTHTKGYGSTRASTQCSALQTFFTQLKKTKREMICICNVGIIWLNFLLTTFISHPDLQVSPVNSQWSFLAHLFSFLFRRH